jgi:hypothetical protein
VPVGSFSRHRRELSIYSKQLIREIRAEHNPRLRSRRRLRSRLPRFIELPDAIGGGGESAKPYERPVTTLDRQHNGFEDTACLRRCGARVVAFAVVAAESSFHMSELVVGWLHREILVTGDRPCKHSPAQRSALWGVPH